MTASMPSIRIIALTLLLYAVALTASDVSVELIKATKEGDKDGVTRLLEGGADPNIPTPTGATALHWAVHLDYIGIAERLIRAGADINAVNRYDVSPILPACINGNATMIELLLEAGANVSRTTPEGATPLMFAARTGIPRAVSILLSHGAEPNTRESTRGQTALMWAAAEGHQQAVQTLIRQGAEIISRSDRGFTAFLFAARQGHLEVIQTLLASGADVNQFLASRKSGQNPSHDSLGPSALGLAVANAHYDLASALLDAGADPNFTWKGHTVLHTITWVRKPGAGSNDPAPPGSGTMPSLEFVRKLVLHGANLNARMTTKRAGARTVLNMRGATPFLLAARTADADLMRLLAELGADPLIPNEDNTTPLIVAAGVGVQSPGEDPGSEKDVLAAVKVTLELGNDINAVDDRNETAMHGAAYKHVASLVPFLVENGARMEVWNQKNKKGWTPLRIATGVHR
ncbi:MAG TPA: hypothetical protein EYQ50_10865 [Verrucomicrobiales bacterium]|nr:hypothetical protein [Verrucomicrobiales bacterium]